MLIAQTLFDRDGLPLGKPLTNSQTRAVRFIPRGSDEPLPTIWLSVDACRAAVLKMQRQVLEAATA